MQGDHHSNAGQDTRDVLPRRQDDQRDIATDELVEKRDQAEAESPARSEAKYQLGEVSKKLTPHVEALKQPLTADAQRLKRKRRTTRALRGQLKADGYAGNYSRLTDTIRAWREEQGKTVTVGAFLSMRFEQGNAFQFDWSEQVLQPAAYPVFGC